MTTALLITKRLPELELRGPTPLVIQLYPGMRSTENEDPQFYAIHLWDKIQKEARRSPPNTYAQIACEYTLGLFGTFLVLRPGGQTPTKYIRDLLEKKSQEWPWDGESPQGPHTVLLTSKQASAKSSFFEALVEVLLTAESTIRNEDRQKLAASLVAMFFSGHPSKIQELAKLVSSQARHGGFSSISVD